MKQTMKMNVLALVTLVGLAGLLPLSTHVSQMLIRTAVSTMTTPAAPALSETQSVVLADASR